ncbi:adenylate cyclase type 8-like [Stegostoma tigrinum]|uniref:adenylate cyclase type 8-like n=1 Tax=Stegostoma tigrinum TaxID=3053191 RepID=UPI00202B0B30|nr:adenylate cyclase type 8-like [Stegostoma tigrinum]
METLVESTELQTTTVAMSHHSPTQSRQWQNIVNVISKRQERLTDSDGVPKRRFTIKNEYIEDINQQIQSKLTGRAKSSIYPTVFATAPVSERMSDIFVSPGYSCLGVLLPTINQTFKSNDLEKLYQRYFARQRRISLMMMNIIDCFTKFNITMLFFVVAPELIEPLLTGVTGLFILFSSMLCFLVQAGKDAISHNYLQYLGLATWFYQSLQILLTWGMGLETNETWFILFIVFGTYTMLPIPLFWGILAGSISSIVHLVIEGFRYSRGAILLHQIYVKMLLLLCMNIASLFISYLSVRAQRMAFLETRKNIEGRLLLEDENERQERLVLSVLPRFMMLEIINDMSDAAEKQGAFHKIYVHQYQNVSIIFADIKGFTNLSMGLAPQQLILLLNELFAQCDDLAEEHNCLRIKILGDCYYAVSGLPEPRDDHAHCCVELGLGMIRAIRKIRSSFQADIDMRIGIHSGFVLCGVLGLRKWQFDVWSLDVNIADKLETTGQPGRIHISEATLKCLKGDYETEAAYGQKRSDLLDQYKIKTYFIKHDDFPGDAPRIRVSIAKSEAGAPRSHFDRRKTETAFSSSFHIDASLLRVLEAETPWRLDHPFNRIVGLNKVFAALIRRKSQKSDKNISTVIPSSRFDEINRRVEHAIEVRSSDKLRAAYLNEITLSFKDSGIEKKYRMVRDEVFTSSVVCCLIVLLFTIAVQSLFEVPEQKMRLGHFICIVFIYCWMLFCMLAEGLPCLPTAFHELSNWIQETYKVRTTIMLLSIVINFVSSIYDMIWCPDLNPFPIDSFNFSNWNRDRKGSTNICNQTEYFVLCGVTSLISCAAFLHLHSIIKLATVILMIAIYTYITHVSFKELNAQVTAELPSLFSDWQRGIVFMLTFMFLVTVFYQGRQIEATARLDFLWRLLARQEMDEMAVMRKHNEDLLNNMLPSHIARYFLDKDPDDEELYCESHENVGVLFASIPEFAAFYSQAEGNQQGIECLQLLNEIIADFDDLLGDDRFLKIEKIKTIGSTYMAVSGLASEQQHDDPGIREDWAHLCNLADFALALESTMEEIQKHSHINFKLRVGFAHGAAVSGVIGVKKPQFDIWGTTVNFASRMDSTGISGKIQVPKETSSVLETRGFSLRYRGQVFIKGMSETFGKVETYFLEGRVTQVATPRWMRRQSAQHSFSVILSGLSQKSSPAWYPL